MSTQQSSIEKWTIPTTEAEKRYYSTHKPKLALYGTVATVVQILWAATSLLACKALFDWSFERLPALQFLAAPLALVTLVTMHKLMRVTTIVYWSDKLDQKTETDSSVIIPALLLIALLLLDYQGTKIFLQSTVKPAEITTTAAADTRYQETTAAAKAEYSAAKKEAEELAKTKAGAIRGQYQAQIIAVQNRRAATDSDRRFIRAEVAKLRAKQAEELAAIEREKAAAVAALLNTQSERTAKADAARERANSLTERKNQEEEARHASDMRAVGGISWGVSVFFALLFSFLTYAQVRIRVRSGILPNREFTGLHAHGGAFHKIALAVQDAFSRQLHRFAVWLHRFLSAGARQLRDFDGKVIFIEPDDAGTLGGGSAIATAERNGARPIGFYRDRAGAPGDVDADGETKNVPHTRADDFRTLVVTDANTRTCEHCGQPYIYRHAKQRFCSNECRVNAWENRTGKEIRRGAGGRL